MTDKIHLTSEAEQSKVLYARDLLACLFTQDRIAELPRNGLTPAEVIAVQSLGKRLDREDNTPHRYIDFSAVGVRPDAVSYIESKKAAEQQSMNR